MKKAAGTMRDVCPVCDCFVRAIFRKGNFDYGRCPECGTVGAHPMPTDEDLKEHYSKAQNYKTLKKHEEKYSDTYKRTAEFLKRAAERKRGAPSFQGSLILDVGCNIGGFVKELLNLGADAYGHDPYVNPADIKCGELKKRISFEQNAFDNISEKMDCLTLIGVIEHLRDPAVFLSLCNTKIKDDGIVFIQTPDSESIVAKIMGKRFFAYQPIEHIYVFSRRGLTKSLERAGFKDIEFRRQWKFLTVRYVYEQLETWGKGFQWLLWPLNRLSPNLTLPFYGGGMTVWATKSSFDYEQESSGRQ